MATVLAKTYDIPVITSHRRNFQGDIYTVTTPGYTDIVIVDGDQARCTCQSQHCNHTHAVQRTRAIEAAESARRASYATLFDLSYGD